MSFTYDYPRPAVTCTVILVRPRMDSENALGGLKPGEILLGRRSNSSDAYPDMVCLPGGFLNAANGEFGGETARQAAIREVREETGIALDEGQLMVIGEYSDPRIDSRAHVVNLIFMARVTESQTENVRAGDDLKEVAWMTFQDIATSLNGSSFAFNHWEIINDTLPHWNATPVAHYRQQAHES